MMTEVCDICNNTDETIRYIKDGHEYNLCRKCMRLVWRTAKDTCEVRNVEDSNL